LHLGQRFKNCVDLAFRARMQATDLETERTCSHLYVLRLRGGSCQIRVDERGKDSRLGPQIMQRFQLLWPQSVNEKGYTRYVSTRPTEAGHQSNLDRIDAVRKHYWDFGTWLLWLREQVQLRRPQK